MYFTLLFETAEGPTEIYELCFHPSVIWMKDGEEVGAPRKQFFTIGDFVYLVRQAEINQQVYEMGGQNTRARKIGIVCHDTGHGREEDLNLMMAEMKAEGFIPQLMFAN